MSCRLICAGLLAVALGSRASACDHAVLIAPQSAIVSPLVVLPQIVVQSPVHVRVPLAVVPQVKRAAARKPFRARSVIRTRTVAR